VAGPGFAHGGFQTYLQEYIASTAVGFYRPILSGLVLPHAVFFGYVVGGVELLAEVSFGARLDTLPMILLLIIFFFFAADAGRIRTDCGSRSVAVSRCANPWREEIS
jgi:hypothetical protein